MEKLDGVALYHYRTMAEYKNQHFVPEFYLRNFSKDKTGVYRYSITKKTFERRNISSTCSQHYFYAKAPSSSTFEKNMAELEKIYSEIVKIILETHSLDKIPSEKFVFLHNFILLSSARTKASKKEGEKLANAVLDMIKPELAQRRDAADQGSSLEDLRDVKLVRDGANHEAMLLAMIGPPLIFDLEITLLINRSKRPFITSDSPVVLYNFIKAGDMGMRGYQSPGIIILLPLNEDVTICLFDQVPYSVRRKSNGNVILSKNHDVNELNRLQLLNADEHVITSSQDRQEYIKLLDDSLPDIQNKEIQVNKVSAMYKGQRLDEVYHFRKARIEYSPHFSFIDVNNTIAKGLSQEARTRALYRHREIVDKVQAEMDKEYAKGKKAFDEVNKKGAEGGENC